MSWLQSDEKVINSSDDESSRLLSAQTGLEAISQIADIWLNTLGAVLDRSTLGDHSLANTRSLAENSTAIMCHLSSKQLVARA